MRIWILCVFISCAKWVGYMDGICILSSGLVCQQNFFHIAHNNMWKCAFPHVFPWNVDFETTNSTISLEYDDSIPFFPVCLFFLNQIAASEWKFIIFHWIHYNNKKTQKWFANETFSTKQNETVLLSTKFNHLVCNCVWPSAH